MNSTDINPVDTQEHSRFTAPALDAAKLPVDADSLETIRAMLRAVRGAA